MKFFNLAFIGAFPVLRLNSHGSLRCNLLRVASTLQHAQNMNLKSIKKYDDISVPIVTSEQAVDAPSQNLSLYTCLAARKVTLPMREWRHRPEFPIRVGTDQCEVFTTLREIVAPPVVTGSIYSKAFQLKALAGTNKDSTVDVDELIQNAEHPDPNDENTFVMDANRLFTGALPDIQSQMDLTALFGPVKVAFKLTKVLIQRAGSGEYQHTNHHNTNPHASTDINPNQNETFLGALAVVFNSTFEGGNVNVSLCGQHASLKVGNLQWVAMNGECTHKVSPVTSGTRVSILYDIYKAADQPDRCYMNGEYSCTDTGLYTETPIVRTVEHLSPVLKKRALCAVNADLQSHDSVFVGLQRLYAENSHDSFVLSGSDRTLYDLLSEQYDVQIVAVTFTHERIEERADAALYYPPGSTILKPESANYVLYMPYKLVDSQVYDEWEYPGDCYASSYLLTALKISKIKEVDM